MCIASFYSIFRLMAILVPTRACQTALNHPTYGTIMYQTSISLCASLSKLSMTLNKRPDLTRQLRTMVDAGGEEEQKSIVEHTTEIIQKIFTACLSDRSSLRNAQPEGKKVGVYIFANVTLKLLFAVSWSPSLHPKTLTECLSVCPIPNSLLN